MAQTSCFPRDRGRWVSSHAVVAFQRPPKDGYASGTVFAGDLGSAPRLQNCINVTLVEPGGFDTDWGGASATVAEAQPQYAALHEGMAAQRTNYASPKPVGFGAAILKIVDAEKPPLRVFFGEQPVQIASHIYQQRLAEWAEWAPVSREAEGK